MTLNDKAKDLRSSGYTLMIVGIAGLVVMIVIMTGLIPVTLNNAFAMVGMTVLFVIFLCAGIYTLKKARAAAEDAERETDKKSEIKKWFLSAHDAASLDEIIGEEPDENDLYFERIDLIKDKICERFIDVEDALMSELTEEIYTELFDRCST